MPFFSNIAHRSDAVFNRVRTGLARRRRYHAVLAELRQMDDRQLDDLGIARADFKRIARDV